MGTRSNPSPPPIPPQNRVKEDRRESREKIRERNRARKQEKLSTAEKLLRAGESEEEEGRAEERTTSEPTQGATETGGQQRESEARDVREERSPESILNESFDERDCLSPINPPNQLAREFEHNRITPEKPSKQPRLEDTFGTVSLDREGIEVLLKTKTPSQATQRTRKTTEDPPMDPMVQAGGYPGPIQRPGGLDEATLSRILDNKLSGVAKQQDIDVIMKKMDENAADVTRMKMRIAQLETRINDNRYGQEKEIRSLIARVIEERMPPPPAAMDELEYNTDSERSETQASGLAVISAGERERERARTEQFDRARRSLRAWPIEGESDVEREREILNFMAGALGMSERDLGGIHIISNRRVNNPERANPYNEVCVEFETVEMRDFVFSRGARLAPFIDDRRRPTAGLRQEIPAFLMSVFKLMKSVAFDLRRQHGKGTKTYVKFDGYERTLYLEARMSDSRNWIRIDRQMAQDIQRESDRKELATMTGRKRPRTNWTQEPTSVNLIPIGRPAGGGQRGAAANVPDDEGMEIEATESQGNAEIGGAFPAPAEREKDGRLGQPPNHPRSADTGVPPRERQVGEREERRGDALTNPIWEPKPRKQTG